MIDRSEAPGAKRDPYLILLRQGSRRHRDALTEAGVEFQDVEVGCGE